MGESTLSYFLLLLVDDFINEIVDLEFLTRVFAEQITLKEKLNEVVEDFHNVNNGLIGEELVGRELSTFLGENFPEIQFESVRGNS